MLQRERAEIAIRPIVTLGKDSFDGIDRRTMPQEQIEAAKNLNVKMKATGFDLLALHHQAERARKPEHTNKEEAEAIVEQLHNAATVLFLQWRHSRVARDTTTEFATARIFNQVTRAARGIDANHGVFDNRHLADIHDAIEVDLQKEARKGENSTQSYDPRPLAEAMAKAGKERTHESAWAWVMLPTFPKQHYGRILLDVIEDPDTKTQVFVTQPTFTDGEATLFHTHGQNWAWSMPLGEAGSGANRHINTMWAPNSREELFPLRKLPNAEGGKAHYSAGDVAVIPPKTIHGIAGARGNELHMPIDAFALLPEDLQQRTLAQVRFGEQSALHIYRGDESLGRDFINNPVEFTPGDQVTDFFESNDMIVFDHTKREAWAGGGGAWAHRMIEYGSTGEHCGKCFAQEADPRMENLPATVVFDRFVDPTNPRVILYSADELTATNH